MEKQTKSREKTAMTSFDIKRSTILLMILIIFTIQFRFHTASAITDAEEAASALANAERAVAEAYNATANADQTGANISTLLTKLSDAGDELSAAEAAYRQGDFNSTVTLARICSQAAEGVKADAGQLGLEALEARYMNNWFKMVVSIVAVATVGLGSFFTWRLFKKRYYQRVLNAKTEAVSHES